MPRPKKVVVAGGNKLVTLRPEDFCKLVEKVRTSKNKTVSDTAFNKILDALKSRMTNMCRRFRIAGNQQEDIYQEACHALRFKAIKDYDKDRGSVEGTTAPFDRFALMCIKRHLYTMVKTSKQQRQAALNTSVSLNQSINTSFGGEDLSLISVLPDKSGTDVLSEVECREYQTMLFARLMKHLSDFEKNVFILFGEKYTYEEIAKHISDKRLAENPPKRKINVKSVDNALSRIKSKAELVYKRYGESEENPEQNV